MKIHLPISWHHFNVLKMKNINPKWIHNHDSIVKTGGNSDVYIKAQIKKQDSGKYILKVYGLDSGAVTIELKTKSERKALELAENYLDSINMINYGLNDEFDLH